MLAEDRFRPAPKSRDDRSSRGHKRRDRPTQELEAGKARYRIDVGNDHGVKPGNIVGAIANEAGLAGEHIGHISIEKDYSLVDLPTGMPRDIFMDLKKVRVCGRPMKIALYGKPEQAGKKKPGAKKRKPKTKK